nr:unnamed protein product [Spirometra erinaceieuropaei]
MQQATQPMTAVGGILTSTVTQSCVLSTHRELLNPALNAAMASGRETCFSDHSSVEVRDIVGQLPCLLQGVNDCLTSLRLPLGGVAFTTSISAYVPPRTKSEEAKTKFYEDLHAVPKVDKLVVLGNFNSRVGTVYATWRGALVRHAISGTFSYEPAQNTASSSYPTTPCTFRCTRRPPVCTSDLITESCWSTPSSGSEVDRTCWWRPRLSPTPTPGWISAS